MPKHSKEERLRFVVDEVSKRLVDQGLLVAAGFHAYRKFVIADDAPDIQVAECKMAFFAGAQHLFGSIMSILNPGDEEPTDADMSRMTQINDELQRFARDLELAAQKPEGRV